MVTPSPPIKHLQHQHPPPRPPRPLNIFWFRSCTYRCSRLTLPIYCDGFVFTGNFDCAILINNYLPKEEVMCFTKPGYTENESKLSTALAKLVYKFIMMVLIINDNDIVLLWIKCNRSIIIFFQTNIHPVKVVFEIPPEFLSDDNTLKIFNVLHLLSRREFEKHHDTKEMLCFKFHYLATILFEISNLK